MADVGIRFNFLRQLRRIRASGFICKLKQNFIQLQRFMVFQHFVPAFFSSPVLPGQSPLLIQKRFIKLQGLRYGM